MTSTHIGAKIESSGYALQDEKWNANVRQRSSFRESMRGSKSESLSSGCEPRQREGIVVGGSRKAGRQCNLMDGLG